MTIEILSKSEEETKRIGKILAKSLLEGRVFGLVGELGVGKTTFIQGVALGLKIKEKIKSPTFVLLKKYKIPTHKKLKYLYHLDLYRLSNFFAMANKLELDEFENILGFSLKEIIQPSSVVFIEWAEKIKHYLPKDWIKIEFKYINKNQRQIKISQEK